MIIVISGKFGEANQKISVTKTKQWGRGKVELEREKELAIQHGLKTPPCGAKRRAKMLYTGDQFCVYNHNGEKSLGNGLDPAQCAAVPGRGWEMSTQNGLQPAFSGLQPELNKFAIIVESKTKKTFSKVKALSAKIL